MTGLMEKTAGRREVSTFLSQPPGLALPFPGGVQGRISVYVNETGASG